MWHVTVWHEDLILIERERETNICLFSVVDGRVTPPCKSIAGRELPGPLSLKENDGLGEGVLVIYITMSMNTKHESLKDSKACHKGCACSYGLRTHIPFWNPITIEKAAKKKGWDENSPMLPTFNNELREGKKRKEGNGCVFCLGIVFV